LARGKKTAKKWFAPASIAPRSPLRISRRWPMQKPGYARVCRPAGGWTVYDADKEVGFLARHKRQMREKPDGKQRVAGKSMCTGCGGLDRWGRSVDRPCSRHFKSWKHLRGRVRISNRSARSDTPAGRAMAAFAGGLREFEMRDPERQSSRRPSLMPGRMGIRLGRPLNRWTPCRGRSVNYTAPALSKV